MLQWSGLEIKLNAKKTYPKESHMLDFQKKGSESKQEVNRTQASVGVLLRTPRHTNSYNLIAEHL